MKVTWKKPWTVIFWILSPDRYETEEGPGPEYRSRFSEKGFWRWLFASEKFEEEPEIRLHKPRFGDRSFISWLFASEGKPVSETRGRDVNPPHSHGDE
ncbi:MAG: hypothetical protein P1S46_08130 [bacterium]|nr:hypothetical protein [bacterium]MDT8367184.1 hypothetical protein [bacterium]